MYTYSKVLCPLIQFNDIKYYKITPHNFLLSYHPIQNMYFKTVEFGYSTYDFCCKQNCDKKYVVRNTIYLEICLISVN